MVRKWSYTLLGAAAIWLLAFQAMSKERGIHVGPSDTPDSSHCWALIIGINDYQYWPKLTTAVHDATELSRVLIEEYGFPENQVITLIDGQATRRNILSALRTLGKGINRDHDSLLIYYAGHGQLDDMLETGYWVPVEAQQRAVDDFIDNAVIRNYIRGIDTLHTLLIADSCFAGSLFVRGLTQAPQEADDAYFKRVYQLKSRQGFTSGNVEPVADTGLEGHSIFAYYFIKALKENQDPYVVPSSLFERIKIPLARNSMQTPIFKPLKDAMDEGGEFVFVLKRPAPRISPQEGTSSLAAAGQDTLDPNVRMRALEEERRRLEAEIRLLEEEKKLFRERQKMDEERRKLEVMRKELEAQMASLKQARPSGPAPRVGVESAVSKVPAETTRPAQGAAVSHTPSEPTVSSGKPAETGGSSQALAPVQEARVRPLESPQTPRREDLGRLGAETILDLESSLVWMEVPGLLTWSEADRKAHSVNQRAVGSITDWHVPSRDEAYRLLSSRKGKAGAPLSRLQGAFWIDEMEERNTKGLGAIQRYRTYLDLDREEFLKSNETLNPEAHKLFLTARIPQGVQPAGAGRFVDRGDGTVLDRETNLVWLKQPSRESMFYDDALAYVKHLNDTRAGGAVGWRLPEVKELQVLVRRDSAGNTGLPRLFERGANEVWSGEQDFSEGHLRVILVVDLSSGTARRMLTEPPMDDDSITIQRERPQHVLAVRTGP